MGPTPLKRDVRVDLGEDGNQTLAPICTDHLACRKSPVDEIRKERSPFRSALRFGKTEIDHLLSAVLTDAEGNKDRAFECSRPCLPLYDYPVQDEGPEGSNDASSMKGLYCVIQCLCCPLTV